MGDYNMWRVCRNLANFCELLAKRENDKRFLKKAEQFRNLSKFYRRKKDARI